MPSASAILTGLMVATSSIGAVDDDIIIIDDSEDVIVVDPDLPPSPDPFAVRARVSAHLDTRLAVDTSFDQANEQIAEFLVRGQLELDVDFADSLSAFAAPNFSYVAALDREGDERALLYLLTPEAWVRYTFGPITFRAGAMTWNWGSSDFIAPNDVINPVDSRQATVGLTAGTKIPIVGAEAVSTVGPFTLRGVIAPFFTSSRFHLTSWDFAALSGRSTIALPSASVDAVFNPAYLDAEGGDLLLTDRPSQSLENATLAARVTWSVGDLDLSASAVHGWDNVPRIVLDDDLAFVASSFAAASANGDAPPFTDPDVATALTRIGEKSEAGQTLYKGEVRRRTTVGWDATYALDPFVLKMDVAYNFSRTVYDQDFHPHSLPWINAVVGIEYFWADRLQVFIEAFGVVTRNVPNNVRLSYFEARTAPPSTTPDGTRDVFLPGVVAAIVYNALDGDLRFELGVLSTLGRGDVGIAPSIIWKLDDHHRLTLSGFAVEGRGDGIGGVYTNTDQVSLAYRFSY